MIVKRPPMGWNSWNSFGPDVNEDSVRKAAEMLISSGLRDLGYEYVVIDDCWAEKERDENGCLVVDKNKFPSGMKALADYIHSLGLKFGMYSCAGTLTCAGYPASFEHEFQDAKTFASWDVDYLKYDYCFHPLTVSGKNLYRRMGMALRNCGRDILFSACSWGVEETHEWIRTVGCGMWRSTGDIKDSWQSIKGIIIDVIRKLPFGGSNCFNDMDMLVVGMKNRGYCALGGCTEEEYRTHFSVWAMLQSPLILGNDLSLLDEKTMEILGNEEVIAINQDEGCMQSFVLPSWKRNVSEETEKYEYDEDRELMFARMLENGDYAVCIVNMSDVTAKNVGFTVDQLGLNSACCPRCIVRDLWTKEEKVLTNDICFVGDLEPHACKLYRLRVEK